MRAVAFVLILAACDPTPHNKRIASAITLAASTAALACDVGQTMSIADRGWPGAAHEGNWLMGDRPSIATLATYNAGVASANAGVWLALPEKYDWVTPLAIGMIEMLLVARNTTLAPRPFCGIR